MKIIRHIAKRVLASEPIALALGVQNLSSNKSWLLAADVLLECWALRISDQFEQAEWEALQLEKLKKLLIQAENVPFWKKSFDQLSFDPLAITSVRQISELPIVTRQKLQNNSADFIAANIPQWRFINATTSGSTGQPLSFYQDKRDNIRRYINNFQEQYYAGDGKDRKIMILGLENHHDLDTLGERYSASEIENPARRQSVFPFIESSTRTLITTASNLKRLAYIAQYERRKLHFRKILYRGEALKKEERQYLSSAFGCELFTTYGSRECSLIGIECAEHSLHLAPWMNFVEVVDDNGRPLPDDTKGDIVITFFENFAMPFIRYMIGDQGRISGRLCKCGRKSKTLFLAGRSPEYIHVKGLISIPLSAFTRFIDENLAGKVIRYQIISRPSSLIFRYVPRSIDEEKIDRVREYFENLVQKKLSIYTEEVSEILPDENGKVQFFKRAEVDAL